MAQYRVKNGHRHGARNQYGPGSLIELSDSEARGFLDKLEKVEDAPAPQPKLKVYSVLDAVTMPWGELDEAIVKLLVAAGYTPFETTQADDEALLQIDGIGPAKLRKIREELG